MIEEYLSKSEAHSYYSLEVMCNQKFWGENAQSGPFSQIYSFIISVSTSQQMNGIAGFFRKSFL